MEVHDDVDVDDLDEERRAIVAWLLLLLLWLILNYFGHLKLLVHLCVVVVLNYSIVVVVVGTLYFVYLRRPIADSSLHC